MTVPERLPSRLKGPDDVVLRRWVIEDAPALAEAVGESVEHLRPWMEWVGQEPLPLTERQAMIAGWEQRWRSGGDAMMGIFVAHRIAGGCGLHRRIAPSGLEIGYWVHPRYLRRGVASTASALLTDAAFEMSWVDHVEIHHDRANRRSAGVPRRLGFTLIDETPDVREAPAEVGVSCRWRLTRREWDERGGLIRQSEGGDRT